MHTLSNTHTYTHPPTHPPTLPPPSPTGALRNMSRSSSCSSTIIDCNGITALSILCASSKHADVGALLLLLLLHAEEL